MALMYCQFVARESISQETNKRIASSSTEDVFFRLYISETNVSGEGSKYSLSILRHATLDASRLSASRNYTSSEPKSCCGNPAMSDLWLHFH